MCPISCWKKMKTPTRLAKRSRVHATNRRSLRYGARKGTRDRLMRKTFCRPLQATWKTMSQRRTRQKAHHLTHSRNQSGKARANGEDAVAVEEAGGTVLLIAARMTRQPVMGARAKSQL